MILCFYFNSEIWIQNWTKLFYEYVIFNLVCFNTFFFFWVCSFNVEFGMKMGFDFIIKHFFLILNEYIFLV